VIWLYSPHSLYNLQTSYEIIGAIKPKAYHTFTSRKCPKYGNADQKKRFKPSIPYTKPADFLLPKNLDNSLKPQHPQLKFHRVQAPMYPETRRI